MKILIQIAIITISALLTCHADEGVELPHQLSALQKKRNKRIFEIDTVYLRELEKLKSIYMRKEKLDEANKTAAIIKSVSAGRKPPKGEDEKPSSNNLSKLDVSSSTVISAHELKSGISRLSGYNAIFSTVDKKLKNATFIRVPWQSRPKMTVTFERTGFFYLAAWGKINIEGKSIRKIKAKAVVTGPWLDGMEFYKITGKEGDVAICEGGECFLIAQDVSISRE